MSVPASLHIPALPAIQAFAAADMAAVDALIRRRLASYVVLINQVAEPIAAAGRNRLRPMLLLPAAPPPGPHGPTATPPAPRCTCTPPPCPPSRPSPPPTWPRSTP